MSNIFDAFKFGTPTDGGHPAVGRAPRDAGAASPSTSPTREVTPPGTLGLVTPLRVALSWLVAALQPNSNQPPSLLDESAIQPTVDVLNQGWALATYAYGSATYAPAAGGPAIAYNIITNQIGVPAAPPTADFVILQQNFPAAGTGFLARLVALSAAHNNGAGPTAISFFLAPQVTRFFQTPSVDIATATVAANAVATSNALGFQDLIIPAGWDLSILFPATAAGETWVVNYAFACLPVGSRP